MEILRSEFRAMACVNEIVIAAANEAEPQQDEENDQRRVLGTVPESNSGNSLIRSFSDRPMLPSCNVLNKRAFQFRPSLSASIQAGVRRKGAGRGGLLPQGRRLPGRRRRLN